ncbi:MAG: SAM-dependent methyltransferase [Gemmatimonadetes bacterium]|nr:SAM-dependent methyltransferase [Gemmatimonadota bacterium]
MSNACPCCLDGVLAPFYEAKAVPVHSCCLLDDRVSALAFPRGRIELGHCDACGFVSNTAFDEGLLRYDATYEDQQTFSPTFNAFSDRLARDLVERYALRDKTVVEVGCGKGDFLRSLCAEGAGRGIGIDPAVIPGRLAGAGAERVQLIAEHLHVDHVRLRADLICTRNTLEHIHRPEQFARTLRRMCGDESAPFVFVEVPAVGRVLEEAAFWDVYYEHCSYFTPGSMARLLRRCAFEINDLSLDYDDQYLLLHARPASNDRSLPHSAEDATGAFAPFVGSFSERVAAKVGDWRGKLSNLHDLGSKIAVWGSGSKCVAFLAALGESAPVDRIIDINPHRQGKYLPGSGARIIAPADLVNDPPDTVVVMNPIYLGEIRRMLECLSLRPSLEAL